MVGNDLDRSTIQVGMVSLDSMHDCQHLTLDIAVSRLPFGQCLRTESYRSSVLDKCYSQSFHGCVNFVLVQLDHSTVSMRLKIRHVSVRRKSSGDRRPTSMARLSSRALVECALSRQSVGYIARDRASFLRIGAGLPDFPVSACFECPNFVIVRCDPVVGVGISKE